MTRLGTSQTEGRHQLEQHQDGCGQTSALETRQCKRTQLHQCQGTAGHAGFFTWFELYVVPQNVQTSGGAIYSIILISVKYISV